MTDLEKIVLTQAGENAALMQIVAHVLARLASEYEDPDAYITTITAAASTAAPDASADPVSQTIHKGMQDAAEKIEAIAEQILIDDE